MHKFSFVAIGSVALWGSGSEAREALPIEQVLQPHRVCSISDVIAIGVDGSRAREVTLAAVVARNTPSGAIWRGMHVSADPQAQALAQDGRAAYDVMDVMRDSLRPLSSEHRWGNRRTAFEFDYKVGKATKLADSDHAAEDVPLSNAFVVPEGPGTHILYQAIPWAKGLRLSAHQVDRWRGAGAARLKPITIEVVGSETYAVNGKSLETWIVRSMPDDGSYAIEELVTKARPHRAIRTSYRSGPDAIPLVSEVRSITNGMDCA